MTDMARQLLQELMGEFQHSNKSYTDRDVCKDYLVKFCPNQLFTNTKADLGQCDLVHDDRLREAYQSSKDRGRLGYEDDFYQRLQRLINDLQRKVKRALDRITAEADEHLVNPYKEEKEEKAIMMDERIKGMLKQIEEYGENGRVEDALEVYMQMEKLKADLNALKERIDSINPMFKNEKRLEVCDVCGAFLVPNDASKRLDAHIEGKQHQGYIRIQKTLDEFKRQGGLVREGRGSASGGDYYSGRNYSSTSSSRRRHEGDSSYRSRSRSRSRSPYHHRDRRGYDDHRDYSRRRRRDGRHY
ncbi:splicing factor [Dipsacomyces acuminosporus]|nr:splicing factor [Dipsacomyces acuminosporus]